MSLRVSVCVLCLSVSLSLPPTNPQILADEATASVRQQMRQKKAVADAMAAAGANGANGNGADPALALSQLMAMLAQQ